MSSLTKRYAGSLGNKSVADFIANKVDFQQKNQFEVILINNPDNLFTGGAVDKALSVGGTIIDTVMAHLFLYSITIPSYGFEYKRIEGNAFVESSVYPESVTLTFLEDVYGITRRYIQYWMSRVAVPYQFQYDTTQLIKAKRYNGRIYKENQRSAKKNAILLLTGDNNIPYYPRIMLYGLRPQSVEEVTIGHEEADKLTLSLTCSIDEIKVPWLI